MYHLFPMRLLKATVLRRRRGERKTGSQNADARSSTVVLSRAEIRESSTARKARPSANPCLQHLSRSRSRWRSMKKTAIVFPECFVAGMQAAVVRQRSEFLPAELQTTSALIM
jgi:hypothetical protein